MNRREFLVASAALCLAGCSGRRASPKPRPKPRPPTLGELESQLRGPLLRPGSGGYGAARVIENERYAIRPRAIALARDDRDVAACVRFAARSPLSFAATGRKNQPTKRFGASRVRVAKLTTTILS